MEDKTNKIFVLGSFVMGFTIKTQRLPVIGETLMGNNFNLGIGGKGFNQAIAAKRAGGTVDVLLCVGKDDFGKIAKQTLKKEGISSNFVCEVENVSSGCGFVTLLTSGENTILIDPGANQHLSVDRVEEATTEISASKILMAQLEIPIESVSRAFEIGKINNCLTILNPAPATELPALLLRNTDILTPNETEAKIILGLNPDADISLEILTERLLSTGVKTIIMTRGKHGALIISKKETVAVSAPQIKALDPTGAGDCFNGHLAKALADGKSIREAVEQAVFAGAYCAQYMGVYDGLPFEKELEQFKAKQKST